MTPVPTAISMATGMASSRPINRQAVIAPEARGIPKTTDDANMGNGVFGCGEDSDNDAEILAMKKNVIKMLAIKSKFLSLSRTELCW